MGSLINVIAACCLVTVVAASPKTKKEDVSEIKKLALQTIKALQKGENADYGSLFIPYEIYKKQEMKSVDESYSLRMYKAEKLNFLRDFELYKKSELSPFSNKTFIGDVRVAQIIYEGEDIVSVLYVILPSSSQGVFAVNSKIAMWAVRTGRIVRTGGALKYASPMQIAIGEYGRRGLSQKFTARFNGSCEFIGQKRQKLER